jgi:hypothetical protein
LLEQGRFVLRVEWLLAETGCTLAGSNMLLNEQRTDKTALLTLLASFRLLDLDESNRKCNSRFLVPDGFKTAHEELSSFEFQVGTG